MDPRNKNSQMCTIPSICFDSSMSHVTFHRSLPDMTKLRQKRMPVLLKLWVWVLHIFYKYMADKSIKIPSLLEWKNHHYFTSEVWTWSNINIFGWNQLYLIIIRHHIIMMIHVVTVTAYCHSDVVLSRWRPVVKLITCCQVDHLLA